MKNRNAALPAGLSIIFMALAAGIAYGYIQGKLIIPGEADRTLQNITASAGLFRGELLLWVLILLCDILAALALYVYLKPAGRKMSFAAALLRIVYVLIMGIALLYLFRVLPLRNSGGEAQRVISNINNFEKIWSRGLIVFGLHLLGLSWLMFKADYIPAILAVLMLIAALAYTGIHLSYALAPQFTPAISRIESILALPMAAGELVFALWLLIRGGKSR